MRPATNSDPVEKSKNSNFCMLSAYSLHTYSFPLELTGESL